MKLLNKCLVVIYTLSLTLNFGQVAQAETAPQTITVTDMIGREVVLEAPATEIVATTPSDAEILYAIGAGETVVGRGSYVNYPEEVNEVLDIGSGEDTNIEEIIALDPELVIMGQMAMVEEQITLLEKSNIPVYVSDANTIEEVYTNIENIGLLIAHEEEAEALIEEMEQSFTEYADKAADKESASVYYEISPLEFGLWTAGENTFMNELGSMIGLENVFKDVKDWAEISEEQVLKANPDFIITTSMPFNESMTPVDEILQREGWEDVTAIKDSQVFQVDSDEFTRPGPRLTNAIKVLYEFVYGQE